MQNRDAAVTEGRIERAVGEVLSRAEIALRAVIANRSTDEDSAIGTNRERFGDISIPLFAKLRPNNAVRPERFIRGPVVKHAHERPIGKG